jgi:hypothetical protein
MVLPIGATSLDDHDEYNVGNAGDPGNLYYADPAIMDYSDVDDSYSACIHSYYPVTDGIIGFVHYFEDRLYIKNLGSPASCLDIQI